MIGGVVVNRIAMVLDIIINLFCGAMNCMLVVMDGLDIVLVIVVVVKLVMSLMVDDVVIILMGRVVVNRLAMVLDIIINLFCGAMNCMLVVMDGLDIVLVIVVVVKLVMSLMVDDVVIILMGRVVVNRLVMVLDIIINLFCGAMYCMLVVMDGLDILLIIIVVVKLRMHVLSYFMLVSIVVLGKDMFDDFVLVRGLLRVVMRFSVAVSEIISATK